MAHRLQPEIWVENPTQFDRRTGGRDGRRIADRVVEIVDALKHPLPRRILARVGKLAFDLGHGLDEAGNLGLAGDERGIRERRIDGLRRRPRTLRSRWIALAEVDDPRAPVVSPPNLARSALMLEVKRWCVSGAQMIVGSQVRGARAILRLTVAQLAEAARSLRIPSSASRLRRAST
jgi:hypothetical protein